MTNDLDENHPCCLSGSHARIVDELDRLRSDLADLAFRLECKGRLDAADVAITTSARIRELRDWLASSRESGPSETVGA
jgi:hypothetical protein